MLISLLQHQYRVQIDKNEAHRKKPVELVWTNLYGRLLYVFLITLPAAPHLNLPRPTTVALAAIHKCDVELKDPELEIHYYRNMSNVDVVDITTVKALVGRIAWDGWWAIIDRSAGLAVGHDEADEVQRLQDNDSDDE